MLGAEPELAQTPFEAARADMDRLLDEAVEKARREHPDQADNAHFAVCAFADEAVLDSDWQGRTEWMRRKLQQVRFQTANAGVEFYERMKLLDADTVGVNDTDPENGLAADGRRQALEVYAACLTLGFKGRHGTDSGQALIDQLAGTTLRQLLKSSGLPEENIFPEAYASEWLPPAVPRFDPVLRSLILFATPLLLAGAIYAAYGWLLTAFVQKWMGALG
jgi:type VI secretion system protein ImpK